MSRFPRNFVPHHVPLASLLNQNSLLAALPPEVRERLLPSLHLVEVSAGRGPGDPPMRDVRAYFPLAGVISVTQELPDGDGTQIALVGREGFVGWSLFMSGQPMPMRYRAQCDGYGLVLARDNLLDEFQRASAFMRQLLRYIQALMTQTAQLALCNRHHSIEQQLSRLLLMSLDRMATIDVRLTQEAAAQLLGVRREGVTEASVRLREAGVITCRRGVFTAVNRAMLEARSCACYRIVRDEYARLLPVHRADSGAILPALAPLVTRDAGIHSDNRLGEELQRWRGAGLDQPVTAAIRDGGGA